MFLIVKTSLKWWNISSQYEMKQIKDYMNTLESKIKQGHELIETRCEYNNMRKSKYHIERMKLYGKIIDGEFYKNELIEKVNKYAG